MAAGSGGRFTAADIGDAVWRGRFLAWGAFDGGMLLGILLAELIDYPRLRAMRLIGVSARSPRRWTHLMSEIETIAHEEYGCELLEALHNPAHARLLVTPGWRIGWHYLSEKTL